ncbi:MAG: hypothetical protein AAF431_07575 [Pseudomonadota bacterium]
MKIFITLLVFLVLCPEVDAHRITDRGFLTRNSIIYNLAGPPPFENVRIEFHTENFGTSLKISEILIILDNFEHKISGESLGIDYYPRLDGLFFSYSKTDVENNDLSSFKVRIPHDREEFVDCGEKGRIKFLKEIWILVKAYDPPEVIEGKTPVEYCENEDRKKYPMENLFE